ncbi:MAG: hypothetical protein KA746_16840 [Pyrinomonadaceae bacterium]|nr:hypothetical protein [Pyrinomonadaceae bacterium]MBP6212406.1 hypothetical protein [Pyrinomonadaceae bacterium]
MIKDFGGRVASVWEGLRPITKKMLVGAMQSTGSAPAPQIARKYYDAHADWEVSRLLTALDEESTVVEVRKDAAKLTEIEQLADTCVRVLEDQTASAEVFIQLAERALKENDYDHLDKLADRLAERFSVSEISEIIRQTTVPQIRAIAYETLAMMPVQSLTPMLDDPLYAGIAASALELKAFEFDSEEARDVLDLFDAENDSNSG